MSSMKHEKEQEDLFSMLDTIESGSLNVVDDELEQQIITSILSPILQSLGENYGVAYGKGEYRVKSVDGEDLPNLLGDNILKDFTMAVLQPINMAVASAINLTVGILTMAFTAIPALFGHQESQMAFTLGAGATLLGIGLSLLAVITPVARLCNMASRAYATVMEQDVDLLDLPQNPVDSVREGLVQLQATADPDLKTRDFKVELERARSGEGSTDPDLDSDLGPNPDDMTFK